MHIKNNLKWLLAIIAVITLTACVDEGTAATTGVDPEDTPAVNIGTDPQDPPVANVGVDPQEPPVSNVIELIPNASSAKINANDPVDVNSSMVVSQDQQTMVLVKDISVSVDRPLFLDEIYQGMIASVETNTDGTIIVTFRDAVDLAEIIDTFSIEVDTSESVLSSKSSGSTTQKLSLSNISLYDKQNTKKMSYSLGNAKSIEGKNEPILRIGIPADYKIPITANNNKINCDFFDASCEGNFSAEDSSGIDLGESTTHNGITFSTEGSYVEVGLGMYLNLFADINRFSDDILRFKLKQSAHFESNIKASITGTQSTDWKQVIPLTEVITVNIPVYGKIVTLELGLQPYLSVGANGEITGEMVLSSYLLRKGDVTLSFDSELEGEDKLQTSRSIENNPENIDQNGIQIDIDADANAFATTGVQLIPSISLANVLELDIGDIRGGINTFVSIDGEIDAGFEVINTDPDYVAITTNLAAGARLEVNTQPIIDYKLNIGIDPIGLDPISFYSQSDYSRLYTGYPITILDWEAILLAAPRVIQTPVSSSATHVTFDIVVSKYDQALDESLKPYVKFYYTTDGSEPIESSAILWDGSEIVITEETTIKVKAVLLNSDYNTSLWSFGSSSSRIITEAVYNLNCPVEINSEGVCIVSSYNSSGSLHSETPYVNEFIEGTKKIYYESGALLFEIPYVNGVKEGAEKEYYESGALKSETPYVNGVIEGVVNEYYESGALKSETPYVNGVIEGIVKEYYQSGSLSSATPYVDGVKEGVEKEYYESGALNSETPYVNGLEEGIEKGYDESGDLKIEIVWVNGTVQSIVWH